MTSITFKNEYGEYTVTLKDNIVSLDDVMQELVKPVLLAATYQPGNINEYIPEV